jgi:hypothetical protein
MPNFLRSTLALCIAACLLSVPFLVIRVGYLVDLIGAKNQIDQLRSDMMSISDVALGNLAGQATAWNQTIRSRQAYNDTWWGDFLIPDDWNDIALLSMPSDDILLEPASVQEGSPIQEMGVMDYAVDQRQVNPHKELVTSNTPTAGDVAPIPDAGPVAEATLEKSMSTLAVTPSPDSGSPIATRLATLPTRTAGEYTYTVKKGDTLSGIAERFNVSVEELLRWNNLSTDTIVPNQELFVTPGAADGLDGGTVVTADQDNQ